jgi:hypothetical protein
MQKAEFDSAFCIQIDGNFLYFFFLGAGFAAFFAGFFLVAIFFTSF